ncbi:hypothetical protein [Xanthomonas sp. MUS 060]|uniref:hypothetical protein n=1 Tax=Xanthomonas sp. MUS 060 TaxID=1588031 RepID=UPI000AC6510F|nr:hypothetical protein [Xanthomonas sp. MUS 060]
MKLADQMHFNANQVGNARNTSSELSLLSDMNFPSSSIDNLNQKGNCMQAFKIGKNFKAVSPQGILQLVSPANNVNGLIVSTAILTTSPGGYVNLYASETAPTAPGDLNTRIIFCANSDTPNDKKGIAIMPYPLFIPAGLGLWATSGLYASSATSTGGLSITWDLLS